MKKIFLIAVVLLMMINFIINYHHEITKEKHTPMADFKTKVEMAPMKEYNDPDFGYVVKYPCFFQQEDTSVSGYQGYARFSFTNHANIILESYVTHNYSNTLQACADSLAQKLHSERTMQASNKAFILSGPVYENEVRVDGYSHYDKFIIEILKREQASDDSVVVFGDGMNDCSMFRPEWFSVAMGNANPLLKAKASYVTDDVDKKGLSNALRRFGWID